MIRQGFSTYHAMGIVAVIAAILAVPCAAEITRFHGVQLDEQYKLMVSQENGYALVFLSARERIPGGPFEEEQVDGSKEIAHRMSLNEELVSVRTEILRTAPPNNLSNPGLKYRVIIEGKGLEPDLVVMHEVGAAMVRNTIVAELDKIGARAGGKYRYAMHLAGPIVVGVLKASGQLPPELPLTIERSQVGRIRVAGESLSRKKLPAGRNLNPLMQSEEEESPERSYTFNVAPQTQTSAPPTGPVPPTPEFYITPLSEASPLAGPITPLGGTP